MALRYLYGIDVAKDEGKAREFLSASRQGGETRARDKILELEREKKKAEAEVLAARETMALEKMREEPMP